MGSDSWNFTAEPATGSRLLVVDTRHKSALENKPDLKFQGTMKGKACQRKRGTLTLTVSVFSDWLDPSSSPTRIRPGVKTSELPFGFHREGNHETQRMLPSVAADTIHTDFRQGYIFSWNEVHVMFTPPPSIANFPLHHQTITTNPCEKDDFSLSHAAQALYHAPRLIVSPHFDLFPGCWSVVFQ